MRKVKHTSKSRAKIPVKAPPPQKQPVDKKIVDNDGVHVGVEDNGIGIMPEHIGRLTERFYRVDPGRSREQGGTGLGLAIVKHVLDRHDASLHVHSVPGEGSLFRCDFELFEHGEEEKAA